jgi:hypothetical protein
MRTVFVILVFTAGAGTVSAQPAIPSLNWEKRSDWVSVKSDVAPPDYGLRHPPQQTRTASTGCYLLAE